MIPVERWTARECRARLASGEVSVSEVADSWRARIAARDGTVRAYVHVPDAEPPELPITESGGSADPPAGLPLAVKDNLAVAGMPLTCGSRILDGYVPGHDAEVVERYRRGGGWVLGKTNLDEFAMGGSCEHSVHGSTRNPWDPSRVPGGSSGGSAAAVAAGMAPWALGSDTGGSVRQPAAFCGVWGLKPTYGRLSRRGLVAYGSSLDQVGPLARDLRDLAWLYRWLARHDPLDETSRDRPAGDPQTACDAGVGDLRFAVPETFRALADPSCRAVLDRAADALEAEGARRVEVDVPFVEHTLPVYYVLACAEASSNLARFDGVRYGRRAADAEDLRSAYARSRREGFGAEVRRRVLLGAFVLSAGYRDAYYERALQARSQLRTEFERAFAVCDLLLTPTVPFPAFGLGERLDDPWRMYAADVCTASINLAGLPALHIPRGLADDGLPRGVQAIAPAFLEETLFRAAGVLEERPAPEFPFDREDVS